jgi:hypothetical protein
MAAVDPFRPGRIYHITYDDRGALAFMNSLFNDGRQLQSWWRGRSWRFWLTVLSPLLVMGGCGLFWVKAKGIASRAEREAAVFHQRLAAGQYAAIYDAAAPAFRARVSRTDSAKYFGAVHDKMGTCKTPVAALGFFTNANTSGTTARIRYRLECASGSLEETLVFAVDGDGPRLLGYNANSPVLVMK